MDIRNFLDLLNANIMIFSKTSLFYALVLLFLVAVFRILGVFIKKCIATLSCSTRTIIKVCIFLFTICVFLGVSYQYACYVTMNCEIKHDYFQLNFYTALVFCFGAIGIFYGWLITQYRHFNDKYVSLVSKYNTTFNSFSLSIDDNKIIKELIDYENIKISVELSLLLKEEYTMFFEMNLYYGKFKLNYLLKPYFYILNIAYAFGMDSYIDVWASAYKKINSFYIDGDKNNIYYQKILTAKGEYEKYIEYIKYIEKFDKYLLDIYSKNYNKLNPLPMLSGRDDYYEFIKNINNPLKLKQDNKEEKHATICNFLKKHWYKLRP